MTSALRLGCLLCLTALMPAESAAARQGVSPPLQPPYRAAILAEPSLPIVGAATPARTFERALAAERIPVSALTAEQLADPAAFFRDRFDLLIVPTGSAFPLAARENLLRFLTSGGDLLTAGGYAFDTPLVRRGARWIPQSALIQESMRRARDPRISLVQNGDFRQGAQGWRADNAAQCTVIQGAAVPAGSCGQVTAPGVQQGARWVYALPVKPGETYLVGANAHVVDVRGPGFGFLAVYQYDSAGKLVTWIDFAHIVGTQPWRRHETRIEVASTASRVEFQAGMYLAAGQIQFTDVTCAEIPREGRINAHYGKPGDGLVVEPTQLTIFSPDQPIQGASLVAASGLSEPWASRGPVVGFEATAQLRQSARWRPLVEVRDRFGRHAGVAGALVTNYAGPFRGGAWAIFGVTNRDVFAGASGERLLRSVVRQLTARTSLDQLNTDYAIYRPGETTAITLVASNHAREALKVRVRLDLRSANRNPAAPALYSEQRLLTIPPGQSTESAFTWQVPASAPDLVSVRAAIWDEAANHGIGGRAADSIESGFCVYNERIVRQGTAIRYHDNAFRLGPSTRVRRPSSLFGTDTYGSMFQSQVQNPLTWYRDLSMMRDHGLHMFENLQFTPEGYRFTEKQWRQIDALIQLSQRCGLVYMAGLLIGQDVVVDDATLQQQAEMCRQFAARYRHVPGLIYYLNGDFQLQLKDAADMRRLWNDFLRARYATDEALRKAWSPAAPEGSLGSIPVAEHPAGSWYDQRAADTAGFKASLVRRWVSALTQAVRSEDAVHPITSEYYQRPFNGIDLRLTMDGMDAANVGYFGPPGLDTAKLLATIKWNDMRRAGKTVNIGEFGVKTHDAWTVERGGTDYHIRRTPLEQEQLFWWVVHAALAERVTKIQNWCWADDPDSIFPWGISWSNPSRPKPALKLYRNLRVFSDAVGADNGRADVALVLPDAWRLGAPEEAGYGALMNAIQCLLATNVPFDVANQSQLAELSRNPPRAVLVPFGAALPQTDRTILESIAGSGGAVYTSAAPGPSLTPSPLHPFTRSPIGKGALFSCGIPWEALPGKDVFGSDSALTAVPAQNLYLRLLPEMGVRPPVRVESTAGLWHAVVRTSGPNRLVSVFPSPHACPIPERTDPSPALPGTGRERAAAGSHVLASSRREGARGEVHLVGAGIHLSMQLAEGMPCAALLNPSGRVIAATGGGTLRSSGAEIARGDSAWILVALDGRPIAESRSLAVSLMGGGRLRWNSRALGLSARIVEWQGGRIVPVSAAAIRRTGENWELTLPANELALVCPASGFSRAAARLRRPGE